MIKFPNGKINIGLNILSKREDGYHNLQTVFYPINVHDALELVAANTPGDIQLTITGADHITADENNLCVKAYRLLKRDFPQLPSIKAHLHKTIPVGAGLGGGSSDGAFMLKLLNEKFDLELDKPALVHYAAQLGSDCAFFVMDAPCFATSRGEVLEPITLDLSHFSIVIINPGIHISTAAAFAGIAPAKNTADLKTLIAAPIETWRSTIQNDFEVSAFIAHPEIAAIKHDLYNKGALYASMSGTGSTVYGIFPKDQKPSLDYPADYFLRWI